MNPVDGAVKSPTNFVAYTIPNSTQTRIGHLDFDTDIVTPLTFASGTPLSSLYEVIEAGLHNIVSSAEQLKLNQIRLLAPISGRDVLAVGKNYVEHAKEFNTSGYDSSDKVDQPTHPVICTKRATSIIAHGDDVLPHKGFTETADYEGEIGVIVGRAGFKVSEANAMDYVWGYTIINDMTARERQRDHKQFYIGKSPDTFCPMGPVAVPKEHLPENLEITTFINGEQRQNATIKDLIFSVQVLIKTLSEGQTLQPGDVLATGTPYGVGFGFRPMKFLKPGDEMKITVTGLGSLVNRIAPYEKANPTPHVINSRSCIPVSNDKTLGGIGLTQVGSKKFFYQKVGSSDVDAENIVFIHGLGGTSNVFTPLVARLSHKAVHLIDLEGHGLSPTSALSTLSIPSLAADVASICQQAGLKSGISLVLTNPELVKDLVLLGPPPTPYSEVSVKAMYERARTARAKGMIGIADTIIETGTSSHTKSNNPLAITAARQFLLGQDPEGYAKACTALATADLIDYGSLKCRTLIVTGREDKFSTPDLCEKYKSEISDCSLEVLENVGHWHLFENERVVCRLVCDFLG